MKAVFFSLISLFIISFNAIAEVHVTVYNQDLALIREVRELDFPGGIGEVRFIDVAARIIPTSVHFKSDGAELLEQNYEFDLVDAEKLAQKFIDHDVEIIDDDGELFRGVLLSVQSGYVLQEKDNSVRLLARDRMANMHFPTLPEGLITRPTLVWMLNSPKGGKGNAEISYLTNGMNWEAEYVAVTGEDDKSMQFTGWVNIDNQSGATYENAKLKLMAGDVQILQPDRDRRYKKTREMALMAADAFGGGFEEEAFYEYHLYTLQRPSTLKSNQVKQISLFPPASVREVKKEYVIEWEGNKGKARVTLSFEDNEANGLGMPLPKGKVRVYKETKDGGSEFIGEDRIDHTPQNEKIKISTGKAFDIVGEQKTIDSRRNGNKTTEEVEIRIRNRKKETVEIKVPMNFWGDWEILDATPGWEKKDARTAEWTLKIKPDEEKVISYRVLKD